MEQLQARGKYNAVSRYEIDDKDDNELADSKFYYQMGSGYSSCCILAEVFSCAIVSDFRYQSAPQGL
jgi:hypothetical protein